MQGMAVVCGILWDVFVRFVWYLYGILMALAGE